MVECKLVLTRTGSTTTTRAAVYRWIAGGRARLKLNPHCTGGASGTRRELDPVAGLAACRPRRVTAGRSWAAENRERKDPSDLIRGM